VRKLLYFFIIVITVIIGCSKIEVIQDDYTKETVENVKSEGFTVITHLSDNMDRGNHDYFGKVVVDKNAFNKKSPKRGEIVYYKTPEFTYDKNPNLNPSEFEIARIIGLPGEKIKIQKGQIYINGKKLDTFYGKALMYGLDKDSYFKNAENNDEINFDKKSATLYFETGMKEVLVPKGHLFVMGDNWSRSIDSVIFGPIDIQLINGKVLGMTD
jgi:signal peptidase I